jgi:microcystin-dependent protein
MNYIGEIRIFTGDFNPPGFIDCDGSILPIALYRELFLVIGYKYNERGSTRTEKYFQLPNFLGLDYKSKDFTTKDFTTTKQGSKFIICVEGYFPRSEAKNAHDIKTAQVISKGNLDSSFEDITAKRINKYKNTDDFDSEWGNYNPNTDEFESE